MKSVGAAACWCGLHCEHWRDVLRHKPWCCAIFGNSRNVLRVLSGAGAACTVSVSEMCSATAGDNAYTAGTLETCSTIGAGTAVSMSAAGEAYYTCGAPVVTGTRLPAISTNYIHTNDIFAMSRFKPEVCGLPCTKAAGTRWSGVGACRRWCHALVTGAGASYSTA